MASAFSKSPACISLLASSSALEKCRSMAATASALPAWTLSVLRNEDSSLSSFPCSRKYRAASRCSLAAPALSLFLPSKSAIME